MLPKELERKSFLSVREIAEFLGVSDETVYRLVKRGELKAVALPGRAKTGRLLILRGDFEAFLRKNTLPGEEG